MSARKKRRGPGKHKKIDKDHPEFELTFDMMLGIRTTVGKAEAQVRQALTEEDFNLATTLRFPAQGGCVGLRVLEGCNHSLHRLAHHALLQTESSPSASIVVTRFTAHASTHAA